MSQRQEVFMDLAYSNTLPKTNIAPKNGGFQ